MKEGKWKTKETKNIIKMRRKSLQRDSIILYMCIRTLLLFLFNGDVSTEHMQNHQDSRSIIHGKNVYI